MLRSPELQKDSPRLGRDPLINPWNMMHMVTYDRMRPLPDVQYDVMCWTTSTGNVLPVIAFPSRNCHTAADYGAVLSAQRALGTSLPVFPVEQVWA